MTPQDLVQRSPTAWGRDVTARNADELCLRFSLALETQTDIVRVMAHLTSSVEYGIHCLLWLVDAGERRPSSRDLAELQGVSPSFVAKIFPKLEKAGLVEANEGVRGGYSLARPADQISFLDIVDAIEGDKPLFDCQQVRGRCALFDGAAPAWSTSGVCAVHAVMIRAEQAMRQTLAQTSLADVAQVVDRKAPPQFSGQVRAWFDARSQTRAKPRLAPEPPS